jgi:hypothetical protein
LDVVPGDVVVSMRAGFPNDGGDEPEIKVGWLDARTHSHVGVFMFSSPLFLVFVTFLMDP